MRTRGRHRAAFTLVELVVVIMIIGILAAIAAPKVFSTTKTATDNSVRGNLRVIRDAIDTYAAANGGALPGADGSQATFYTNMQQYLRNNTAFPSCPVGAKNNQIRIQTSGNPLTADASPTQGWAYDNVSGQFICNSTAICSDGVTAYSSF